MSLTSRRLRLLGQVSGGHHTAKAPKASEAGTAAIGGEAMSVASPFDPDNVPDV